MQPNNPLTSTRRSESLLATNAVLRNTYMLLGLTLAFSAVTAWLAVITNARPSIWVFLLGAYGLMFLTQALRNSIWGLASVFAFTGFMGYTLGPLLNVFLHKFVNGGQLIMTALGGTGLVFLALSGYALSSKKDFSFLHKFLFIGAIVLIIGVIANLFLHLPAFQLAMSAAFVLFSSAIILFQTSQIIHGGERNYIMATITLYVAIYNLFVSLLTLLGAFSGRD